jgi:hypothetical protein
VLVGPMGETKLSFLPHFSGFRASRRFRRSGEKGPSRGGNRRAGSPFGFFGFILPGESVVNGAVALNPKGEFLGMAVQGPRTMGGFRPRGPTSHDGGKKPKKHLRPPQAARSDRPSRGAKLSFVLSQRLLMGRAERWNKKTKDLVPNRILLGISLDWKGARRDKAEGVIVSDLFPGAPASRAGIQIGDRLLRFGDRSINSRKDLLEAIGSHKVGEVVPVLLRRKAKEIPVQISLD